MIKMLRNSLPYLLLALLVPLATSLLYDVKPAYA